MARILSQLPESALRQVIHFAGVRPFGEAQRYRVLEPDEGKLSSPVLRGLEASNGLRLLGKAIGRESRKPQVVQSQSIRVF